MQQWCERDERPGWAVAFTTLSGRLPDHPDAPTGMPAWAVAATTGLLMATTTGPARAADADTAFWAAAVTKLAQRGDRPPVPADVAVALPPGRPDPAAERAALSAGAATGQPLDPALQLHPTYEQPFFTALRATCPRLARWTTPQAPLDALIADPAADAGSAHRFLDFLIAAPWLPAPVAVELDGSGHATTRRVDAARDRLLTAAGITVLRHPGAAALDHRSPLWQTLTDWEAAAPDDAPTGALRQVHGPAATHRLATALASAVLAGHLPVNAPWRVALHCDTGAAAEVLAATLGLLRDVADVWRIPVVPDVVDAGGYRFHREAGEYLRSPPPVPAELEPHLTVHVQMTVPPWAALPPADGPTVVLRTAAAPTPLMWLPAPIVSRRRVTDPDVPALRRLLRTTLGHPDFRPGQLTALTRMLAGGDAVVLLPTGAGKSAVYMLAGLLHPGTTVVVAPITGLLDDQERRLRAHGITRVAALHAARTRGAAARDRAYEQIAAGHTLIALVTPERLQSATFREQLTSAARMSLVNLAVVDEAHCLSEYGHSFRPGYLRLGANLRTFCADADGTPPPLLALTGTASPAVLRDVVRELDIDATDPAAVQRPEQFDRPNLTYHVRAVTPTGWRRALTEALTTDVPAALGVDPALLTAARGPQTTAGLVFTPHTSGRYGVRAVTDTLTEALARVPGSRPALESYTGGRPSWFAGDDTAWAAHKARVAAAFAADDVAALVTTKAFGMGIDKPNIAWTVHVGMPGSIEAFAQEAGRAGRDGRPALCTLLAVHPAPARAEILLHPATDPERRRALVAAGGDDDITRQLFFTHRAFTGTSTEFAAADEVLTELAAAGPSGVLTVPMHNPGADPMAREKALYRLGLIGVVADYTVDYGAATFTVTLAPYTAASVDAALLDFIRRIEPNRSILRRQQLAAAPTELTARIRAHLATVLDILYSTVEPARVRATAEMYALTVGNPTDADVRARISAYLHEGPIAATLSAAVSAPALDLPTVLRALDTLPPIDGHEWLGAAARQLERAPDHPLLLIVRALGEAFTWHGSQAVFATHLGEAFAALDSYGVPSGDGLLLVRWTLAQLRNGAGGRRWPWVAHVYAAWDAARDPAALTVVEDQVLAAAAAGHAHPTELTVVLGRRLPRLATDIAAFTVSTTAPATDTDPTSGGTHERTRTAARRPHRR